MSATITADLPVIVVVEDDEIALEQRARSLEELGCRVIPCGTYEAALTALHDASIDLVLTDIRLRASPGDRGGVALARFVKSTRPGMPVLGYSAVFADKDLSRAEKEPFDEVWSKDLSYMEIDEMLERCRALAESHRTDAQKQLIELFLTMSMFETQELTEIETVLASLNEDEETALRYVGQGMSPAEVAHRVDLTEEDLYRLIAWVLEELPPGPAGRTMSDVHRDHGVRAASQDELVEFDELYGESMLPEDEG
jgi:CheY-like chemotaxis protein